MVAGPAVVVPIPAAAAALVVGHPAPCHFAVAAQVVAGPAVVVPMSAVVASAVVAVMQHGQSGTPFAAPIGFQ